MPAVVLGVPTSSVFSAGLAARRQGLPVGPSRFLACTRTAKAAALELRHSRRAALAGRSSVTHRRMTTCQWTLNAKSHGLRARHTQAQ
jgi:hypothetical protein